MELVLLFLTPLVIIGLWRLLTLFYDTYYLKSLTKAISNPIDIEKASEKELHRRIIVLGEYLHWQFQRGEPRDPLVQAEVRAIDQELKIRSFSEQVEWFVHKEASRSK